ncbi:MAG TPA: hypothetical protein VN201_03110 [Roseateles sp.]|nr:hypothetical protein [Roseateles sp.]
MRRRIHRERLRSFNSAARLLEAFAHRFVALAVAFVAPHALAGPVSETLADSPARIGAAGAGLRLVANAQVDAFSDPAALLRLDDDDWGIHARSRHALNHAALASQASAGVESDQWRLVALSRSGGVATATPDAVRLLGLLDRKAAPGSGERFVLDYRLDYWQARGLSLGRSWRWLPVEGQRIELGAAVQYLAGIELLHQVFNGTATPAGPDRMVFDGQNLVAGNRMNTDDPSRFNPFVKSGHPAGHGHSLNLGLRWTLSDHWQLELAGFDIAARLNGTDMPESLRVGKFLYDGEGRLIGNADGTAAIQGLDRRSRLTLRPRTRWVGRAGWQDRLWGFDLLAQTQAGVRRLEMAARRNVGESGYWIGASVTTRNTGFGLTAGNQWFSVGLSTSHLRIGDARAISAATRISWPL